MMAGSVAYDGVDGRSIEKRSLALAATTPIKATITAGAAKGVAADECVEEIYRTMTTGSAGQAGVASAWTEACGLDFDGFVLLSFTEGRDE
jgi:hypothetical protein